MNSLHPKRVFRALGWLIAGSTAQRRRVLQELASRSANLFGDFPISDDHKMWREDRQFFDDFARLSPISPYSQDRKFALREFAYHTKKLPGAMAECGCYVGVSAYFMAQAAPEAKLFLFDSFSGLSKITDEDRVEKDTAREWQEGDLPSSKEDLERNLSSFENIIVLDGWIPERFSEVADQTFRLVHIDVDLYEPTRDSLEFFYPRMTPGGMIVMDDYGFFTCPGAYRAANEIATANGNRVIHLPTGQGLLIKPS